MNNDGSLEKIAKSLDGTFVSSEIKNDLCVIEKRSSELTEYVQKPDTLKDKIYIEENIKELIEISKDVLKTVKDDIKIGASPRQIEVFSTLTNAITNQIKELRDLNKMIYDLESINSIDDPKPGIVNISMTSDDLLDMIKDASKNSELNKIDADFDIENYND